MAWWWILSEQVNVWIDDEKLSFTAMNFRFSQLHSPSRWIIYGPRTHKFTNTPSATRDMVSAKMKNFLFLLTFDISSPMVHRDKAWSIPLRTALCEKTFQSTTCELFLYKVRELNVWSSFIIRKLPKWKLNRDWKVAKLTIKKYAEVSTQWIIFSNLIELILC